MVYIAAEISDSGQYGIMASNTAGRSECMADIVITELIVQQAPQYNISATSQQQLQVIFWDIHFDIKK